MKPLLADKIVRGVERREWTPSADHLTDDGRDKFKQRQLERIAAAEKARIEANTKIAPITKRKQG